MKVTNRTGTGQSVSPLRGDPVAVLKEDFTEAFRWYVPKGEAERVLKAMRAEAEGKVEG
jgi:hypothetical protein